MVVGHGNVPGDHGARGAASKSLGDEVLAIVVRAAQRPKHVARLDLPAIALDASQRRSGPVAGRVAQPQPSADHMMEFAEGRHETQL